MKNVRRYDLDWLRVLVFSLLILYHVGMFFVPWGWHIKNNEISEGLTWPMLFLNQWRIPILFIISGMGTCFALSKRSGWQFFKERHNRLMIPLIVGMVVVIAPQVFVERLVEGSYSGDYITFYIQEYFTKEPYPTGNFSWHHLWFLPYLFLYSVVLAPLFLYLRNNPRNALLIGIQRILEAKGGILLLLLPLFLVFIALNPLFPVTHALVGDWYYLLFNLILFLYGYLFISLKKTFWKVVARYKTKALILGILSFIAFGITIEQPESSLQYYLYAAVKMVNMGSWIIVIFGYAAQYLNKPSKLIAYCNRAVYPFYIFHQTVTVVCAYYLYDSSLSIAIKFLILTVATFGISWVLYEIVKRFTVTCILFGIKTKKKVTPSIPKITSVDAPETV